MLVDHIGFIAAFCSTFAFAPQLVKVLKTGDTSSLSLLMYLVFSLGVLLWLIYGILRSDMPVIVANAVTLVLALIILTKKVHNDYFSTTKLITRPSRFSS